MKLKSTKENLQEIINQEMIRLHNKTYKYKVYTIYGNEISGAGGSWVIEYNKDKSIKVEKATIQDIREYKLKELGI
jgi:hypothetical protein